MDVKTIKTIEMNLPLNGINSRKILTLIPLSFPIGSERRLNARSGSDYALNGLPNKNR